MTKRQPKFTTSNLAELATLMQIEAQKAAETAATQSATEWVDELTAGTEQGKINTAPTPQPEAEQRGTEPSVGTGFLRIKRTVLDSENKPTAWLMRGSVNLPGHGPVFLEATFLPNAPESRVVSIKQFGGEWPKVGEFTLPTFANGIDFVEVWLPIGARKFKTRFIRQPGRDFLLVRIPNSSRPEHQGAF